MRTLTVVVSIVTLCLIPGCGSSGGGESVIRAGFDFSTIDVIAVVDVEGAVESENIKDQIADSFLKQMLKKGYGPVGRQLVKRQLAESNIQIQDLKGEAYAVEAGRFLKVPAVLIINVPNFGEETSITAKIMEVNTGSALWVGSGAASRRRGGWLGFSDEELGLGSGIFNSSQGPYTTSEEQKKKDQQRRAQRTLSVRESKEIEKIVKDICESLPYRSPDLKPTDRFFKMPKFSSSK
jgi:hypothetical protein